MLTALAHLILACSRSRSLIADSIRDEPSHWEHSDEYYLTHRKSGIRIRVSDYSVTVYWNSLGIIGREVGWAESRLVRRASKALIARGKAKELRQFDKALKAALTGDE